MLTGTAAAQEPVVLRVRAGTPAGEDGLTWGTAFEHVQAALDAAEPLAAAGTSVQVWVSAGWYVPTWESTPGVPESKTFVMRNRIALMGGFPVTGNPGPAERNPVATVLSGAVRHVLTAQDV